MVERVAGMESPEPRASNSSKRSRISRYAPVPGNHAGSGFHLVTYGKNAGACMCLSSCCYDAVIGCTCRSCSGRGHEACAAINAERAQTRKYHETARAKKAATERAADAAESAAAKDASDASDG